MKTYKKEMVRVLVTSIIVLAIGLGALIAGLVLSFNESETPIGSVCLFIGFVFTLGSCLFLTGGIARVRRSFCSKCKTFIDYENDVEWMEEDETFGDRDAKVNVRFITHCSNCGHEKHFTKKITSARIVKDNAGNEKVQVINVQNQIRKMFL